MNLKQFKFNAELLREVGLDAEDIPLIGIRKADEDIKDKFREFLDRSEGFKMKELSKYHDKLD